MSEKKNEMSIIIRQENENDYQEVENLTKEAFWDLKEKHVTDTQFK